MNTCLPEVLTGAQFSTYRIGGPIQEAYQPTTLEEAVAILQRVHQRQEALTILGAGSNSIISSQGIGGITLITKKMTWIEPQGDNRFRFGAGVHLAKAAKVAEQHALSGAEFMIGIPGTIGGAIRMNAGALGQETATVLREAFVYDLLSGELEIWNADRLNFGYRQSAIDPKRFVVLGGAFEFEQGERETITALMEQSMAFRKTHHPSEPNGGSVFQNPSKEMTVGRMLDEAGAKQWVEGGVRISLLHANFIVNTGSGTSTDVLRLMCRMKQTIQERYGYTVHPENLYIGNASPEDETLWKELTGGEA